MYGFHFLVWFLCVKGVKDTQVGLHDNDKERYYFNCSLNQQSMCEFQLAATIISFSSTGKARHPLATNLETLEPFFVTARITFTLSAVDIYDHYLTLETLVTNA